MEKILISACFLGEKVRYDGNSQRLTSSLIHMWQQQGRLVSLCPEVFGGLAIPRQPAEIQQESGQVLTCTDQDVTQQFFKGANQALALCQKFDIRYALMKESSPSCGSTSIYDGTFTQTKISGEGITSALLRKNGIQVFSEKQINALAKMLDELSSQP
ncbi:DUF523 domain-containing protein [Colwelliaceae bacterium 6441]